MRSDGGPSPAEGGPRGGRNGANGREGSAGGEKIRPRKCDCRRDQFRGKEAGAEGGGPGPTDRGWGRPTLEPLHQMDPRLFWSRKTAEGGPYAPLWWVENTPKGGGREGDPREGPDHPPRDQGRLGANLLVRLNVPSAAAVLFFTNYKGMRRGKRLLLLRRGCSRGDRGPRRPAPPGGSPCRGWWP